MEFDDLTTEWREFAHTVSPFARGVAKAFESCADQLEARLATAYTQDLTATQAASILDKTPGHVRCLIREGKLPNRGRKGAPRFRIGDLEGLGYSAPPTAFDPPEPDSMQIVQSVIDQGDQ